MTLRERFIVSFIQVPSIFIKFITICFIFLLGTFPIAFKSHLHRKENCFVCLQLISLLSAFTNYNTFFIFLEFSNYIKIEENEAPDPLPTAQKLLFSYFCLHPLSYFSQESQWANLIVRNPGQLIGTPLLSNNNGNNRMFLFLCVMFIIRFWLSRLYQLTEKKMGIFLSLWES